MPIFGCCYCYYTSSEFLITSMLCLWFSERFRDQLVFFKKGITDAVLSALDNFSELVIYTPSVRLIMNHLLYIVYTRGS